MFIDSVIIRLIKNGVGIGSDYSISIYGTGKVLYEGTEKVKVKGVVESSIDNDKLLLLLSEFKEKGFFSLNDSYGDEVADKPHTKISISFQKKDGGSVTKRVRYAEGDANVPKELIELEEKIKEIVNAAKWVGTPSDYEEKKEQKKIVESIDHIEKSSKTTKKKPGKLVTTVAALAIVAVVIIFFAVSPSIFNEPSTEEKLPNNPPTQTNPWPKNQADITVTPPLYVTCNDKDKDTMTAQWWSNSTGDWALFAINTNITTGTNITIVFIDATEYNTTYYWSVNITDGKNWTNETYSFKTSHILDINYSTPEITILSTANYIGGIGDYNSTIIFFINDTVWVYEEYANVSTINNKTCNITLEISVEDNKTGTIWHTYQVNKTKLGNLGEKWWFFTNESWPSDRYYVTATIRDNLSNTSSTQTTFFILLKDIGL